MGAVGPSLGGEGSVSGSGLLPNFGGLDALVTERELVEKGTLAFNCLLSSSKEGRGGVGVSVGRNEGSGNDPPDDEEKVLGVGGACGVPNPACVRRSSMTCIPSLSGSGKKPVPFEEPEI